MSLNINGRFRQSFQKTREETVQTRQNENINSNQDKYIKGLIDDYFRTNTHPGMVSVRCISSKILQLAPEWFFDKYQPLVQDIAQYIQKQLSNSDKSQLIASINSDPTNEGIKEEACHAIRAEYVNYENESTRLLAFDSLDNTERKILFALVANEIMGLGPLEPLFRDFSIREIMCNGPFDIQVEIRGTPQKVPSCKFRDKKHLNDLITKLYASINRDFTRTNPGERARLHDNSRIFAVHEVVAPSGPSLNIRRHTEDFVTPMDIINYGSASEELMEYIGQLIYAGASVLVVGGTASGKTTLLNSLTSFYREDARVLILERNLEMKPHPKKLIGPPMEVIPPKYGDKRTGVPMRTLVEWSTQMRPDIIVIGETTDEAAYDLAQALNTGHSGASTIHANGPEEAMERLMSLVSQADLIKGESAYKLISAAFDIVVTVERFPEDGSRRITSVCEVGTAPEKAVNGQLYLPVTYLWDFEQDPVPETLRDSKPKVTGKWVRKNDLSDARKKRLHLDVSRRKTWEELIQIASVD